LPITLKKDVVIDRWWMLVEGASDKVEQVFEDTETNIRESKAPDLKFERVKVGTGYFDGILFGKERDFIQVKDTHLPGKYEMYIGVREYGKHLDLVWYLTYEPGLITWFINKILFFFKKKFVLNLDLFDEHDLKVYATVIHHCFLQAVEKVTKGTGQEIDRKSKGFLGIS
jgi:hypothetical protein